MNPRRQKPIGLLVVLFCSAAQTAAGQHATIPPCVEPLANVVADRGYRLSVSVDDTPVNSVVDAADAHARQSGADVVLVRRGDRIHALAPGLSHATTRRMARAAEATDDPLCTLATQLARRIERPRWQRMILAALLVFFLAIARGAARRAQNAK
jgi:hypothetical protein